jgi:YfiH family protein
MKTPRLQYYDLGEGVTAFSTTRQGGYSQGNYGEFNINRYCGDSEEAIRQNRQLLCQTLGIEDSCLLMPHQVHLTETTVVDEAFLRLSSDEQKLRLEGVDAVMTSVPGVCIGVSTADCIPVLLYDQAHHASCAIHAGWRGTVRRIVEKAVARMTEVYGSRPEEMVAQIGPGIHLESFEVGDEVFEAFAQEGFQMESISRKYPVAGISADGSVMKKWHIDLPMCNRQQLLAAGLPDEQIAVSPVCTFQQSETYFSARRLGINSGRIFTGILLA